MVSQRTSGHRVEQLAQRGLEKGKHCLRFRVAEAAIEFHHGGAFFTPGKASVEEARVGASTLHHFLGDGFAHLLHDALDTTFWKPRQRTVGAHTAGVGAFVIVIGALVVLSGQQRHHSFTVN